MEAMERLAEAEAVRRLVERDTFLFTDDIDARMPIMQRLGWTDLASKAEGRMPLLDNLAQMLLDEGATDVILLGMGGSSLAPLVLSTVIGSAEGMPRLHVLDTTSPVTIRHMLDTLPVETTFGIVASKSGTTIEPLSLYAIFREWTEAALGRHDAGAHYLVITDPDTPLEKLRKRDLMRMTLSAPATVGGRFSALSMFGLAPSALIGIDLRTLISRAEEMEKACETPLKEAEANPGAELAAWLVEAERRGRNKLTLVCSPGLEPFGLWVEQLVAESLGKEGRGIVPVIEYDTLTRGGYDDDRAFAVIRYDGDEALRERAADPDRAHPVIDLVLGDSLDLGREFVRWEYAVALAGFLMGINPFDEPNVTEAKRATTALLEGSTEELPRAAYDLDGAWVTLPDTLGSVAEQPAELADVARHVIGTLRPGDYFAILAYLPEDEATLTRLRSAAHTVSEATRCAACVELGPRYLHSTGQLHKGGPNTGVYLMVTARDRTDVAIPGQDFGLAALHRAQAEGDLMTLVTHGRRVARFDMPSSSGRDIDRLADALEVAVRA